MAAKVAVVVVPTVLGIASIRVYTVKEKLTDGLLPRERLNIYTPLSQSAQAQVIPERPGVIQSGITTARESIQPFVQASKNAYSSVKTGSIKLSHTLEDVYFYLKDPPPEFLPRFGTITMAGLLGMFLARKGSRFKRTAVPLGLMSAAASVCYPAQAVAAVKVTGKKAYAAGQWSGAAVASLFVSKPQEPVTKDSASPQPQAEEVPVMDSAGSQDASEVQSTRQSPTIPQREAASLESVPVTDQPVTNVMSEEGSMTLEVTLSQTPTDAGNSSEEPSETKQASSQPVSEVSTPIIEQEPAKAAPTEAPTEAAQTEDTPIEATPAEATPAEATPADATPAEATPAEATPAEATPAEATPAEATPAEATPAEATPAEATPAEATPAEATPAEATPAEATPAEATPAEATPAEATPAEVTSLDSHPSVPVVIAELPHEAAAEETAAEHIRDGSGFKADPALMDFGQSSPEDEDLYSTRS